VLVWLGQEVQEVPRGLSAEAPGPALDPVREFIRAFNDRDLDAFAATLHPDVEIHSMRVRGGVQQTAKIDELWEGDDRAVALITRDWHWDEDGTEAGSDEMAWLFELEDGLIRSWRPFNDRDEALQSGGFKG